QYGRDRYYDPKTGRWQSQDRWGFAAFDPNLYRYVGNNTPNGTDPSGMVTEAQLPYMRQSYRDFFTQTTAAQMLADGPAPAQLAFAQGAVAKAQAGLENFLAGLKPDVDDSGFWSKLWRDIRMTVGYVFTNPGGAARAFGEGLRDGSVIVGNALTFNQIAPLSREAQRLIQETGGLYAWGTALP